MFSPKRPSDYQGYRLGADRTGFVSSMSVLIGAAIIAVAILLSTLVTAVGTRYVGIEGPTEDSAWLVDRLTGAIYKCEAQDRGPASCEPDVSTGNSGGTGSSGGQPKP